MSARNETLERLQLIRGSPPEEPLRVLCHHDYLVGGMSISLDVKPDEALGQLLLTVGGPAPGLRVLDVVGPRPWIFSVKLADQRHEWEVDGLEALIDTLNIAYAPNPDVKALVQLGEWEDMLQVWALPKPTVSKLLAEEWFRPSNPVALERALAGA
jgi:hypothetical protein